MTLSGEKKKKMTEHDAGGYGCQNVCFRLRTCVRVSEAQQRGFPIATCFLLEKAEETVETGTQTDSS